MRSVHASTRAARLVTGCLVVQLLVPAPAARAASTDASTLPTARRPAANASASGASSPAADPFTGAATFALPLALPPGTGGATPEIALRYSSHARGASWVGAGWSLGLPAIRRSLARGTPSYDDAADAFELAGERLVPESASPALPRRYRTLREQFVRVVHEANGSWTVTAKDGSALRFGLSSNARVARADGAVFEWLLQEQEDTHGNVALAAYDRRDPGTAYLQTIRYTLRRPAGGGALQSLGGDPARDRRVEFVLEAAPRGDVVESRRAGFLSRVAHRLDFVDVRAAGVRVRRYDLRYEASLDTGRSLLAAVAHYGSDAAAASPTPPFVTRFAYHSNVASGAAGFERVAWSWPAGISLVAASRRDEGVRLADVDGDGRPDLVKALAVASGVDPKTSAFALSPDSGVYLNTGSGFETAPSARHPLPSFAGGGGTIPFSLAWQQGGASHTSGFDVVDVTGDGRADLVGGVRDLDPATGQRTLLGMPSWYAGTPQGFAPIADAGGVLAEDGWGLNRSGVVDIYVFTATVGTTSGNARFADLTGDGLPELLVRGVERKGRAAGGPYPFASSTPTCLHERRSHYYFENRGDGVFERAPVLDTAGSSACESSLHRIASDFQHCDAAAPIWQCGYAVFFNEAHPFLFEGDPVLGTFPWYWLNNLEFGVADVDLDGDGLADTVSATRDPIRYGAVSTAWLNDGARGYVWQPAWALPPGVLLYELAESHSIDQGVRFADLNGDGRTDLVRAKAPALPETWLNDGDVDEAAPTPWEPTDAWPLPDGVFFADENGRDTGVRLVDVDGDGMTDVVRSFGAERDVWRNRGSAPDLLTRVVSPLGAETEIAYEPSSAHDVHGGDATPDLPFPLPVVAAVSVHPHPGRSGVASETFRYEYWGGRYDAEARELRGFARVAEIRSDGRRVERSYAQDEARAGALLAERITDAQGRPWLEQRFEYLADATAPYAVLPVRIERLEYDGAATPRRSRTDIRYGATVAVSGNPVEIVEYGEVSEAGADLAPGDTRRIQLAYAENAALHLLDRVAVQRVRAADGAVVRESRFFYDGDTSGGAPPVRGDVTMRVDVLGEPGRPDPTTTIAYDVYGNPVRITPPRAHAGEGGGATSIEYDALLHTFPVAIGNALGHRRELDYAAAPECAVAHSAGAGLVARERGPNDLAAGTSWLRCYDAFGRIAREVAPASLAETLWSRSDAPLAAAVTESQRASATGWRWSATHLDGLGRPVRVERSAPAGGTLVETRHWDAHGRLALETAPGRGAPGPATSHRYDVLDREIETELPGGGRRATRRWDRGVVEHVDPTGVVVRRHVDALGRVARVEEFGDGGAWTTTYAWDAADALVAITDHHGNRTAFEYDRLGRRTRITDPNVGTVEVRHDAEGSPVEQRGAGETVTWSYDALGRPLHQIATSTRGRKSVRIAWRWDAAEHGIGLLSSRADDSLHTQRIRAYDLLGRPLRSAHLQVHGAERLAFEFENEWDRLGQPAARRHPTGTVVRWDRDALGFVTAVRSDGLGVDAANLEWSPEGRLERWTAPGGVVHERRFDDATRRLAAIRVVRAGAPLVSRQYAYDDADRVTRIDDLLDPLRSLQLGYDAQGRLERTIRYESGTWLLRTNAYDPIGNLLCRDARAADCAGGTRFAYPSDAAGRATRHQATSIGGLSATYADGGQTVAVGERRFAYDALGRLVEAWQGAERTLAADYAADGRAYRLWSADAGERELLLEPDFEWLGASREARIHVLLGDGRVATHTLAFDPAAAPSTCAGAPLVAHAPGSPSDLFALFAPGFAALLLLGARRALLLVPAPRRWDAAVAASSGVAFLVVVSVPAPVRERGAAFAQSAQPASVYHHADHLGGVLAVTTPSGATLGAPVSYEPWGRLASGGALATRFGFHGNRAAAGLYDYGVRWYDPQIGRFLQPDPVIADPLDPQQLSPYAYVRNDPVNRVDPTGAWSLDFDAWAGQVDQNGFTGVTVGFSFGGGGYFEATAGVTVAGRPAAQARYAQFVDDAFGLISKLGAFQLFNAIGALFKRTSASSELPAVGAGSAQPSWATPQNRAILLGLDPYVAHLAVAHLVAMKDDGLDARLTHGFRSYEDQDRFYAQGRSEPGHVVTRARGGESWHNFGLAYDIAVFRDGELIRNGDDRAVERAGKLGEETGLEWGGRWRSPDPSHFQYRGGLSLKSARMRWERGLDVLP